MKKLIFLLCLVLVPSVMGFKMRFENYGPEFHSHVYVHNPTRSAMDADVNVGILNSGLVGTETLYDIEKSHYGKAHMVSDSLEPGEYLMRVSVYKNGKRSVKHRRILIR